jgi:nucleoside-diphosphate-sugar epimerase
MSPGKQIRDFVKVEDVASALLCIATKKQLTRGDPKIFNIGTGIGKTIESFAQEEWERSETAGKLRVGALPYRSNEVMRLVAGP